VSVHLAYFTALVDETASLKVLPDLYGHDRRLRSALGLDG
jgi:murein L,D-transpeptidase YcbB/YkuD